MAEQETTISITRYSSEYKEQWNRFVADAKNGLFMFDRNYMEYHSDRFKDHSLMFWKGKELIAILPASEKDGILTSHGGLTYGGLVINDKAKQHTVIDCIVGLKEYTKTIGIQRIVYKAVPHIYQLQPAEEDLYALYQQDARILTITASTVINLKNKIKMPKGRKAQISRAKREGVKVLELTTKADYISFIELENEVLSSRHGINAVHTGEELFLLHGLFPQNIRLIGSIYRGILIAGTVVYVYETAIHTQYMAANEKAREIGALDLAISTIMDEYKDTKQWLDFGISTDHDGSILNNGLISQKEGFGGRTNVYTTWILGG